MFDRIDIMYTCGITSPDECKTCNYYSLCKLYLDDYINYIELSKVATIQYAEGEI